MPSESVKVVVRCRPLSKKEASSSYKEVVLVNKASKTISIKNENNKMFTFDAVYDWTSTQKELYNNTFFTLIQSVLEGFNGTIFAYGQTGTGKTFTMQGDPKNTDMQGVIPNSFCHIFDHISSSRNQQYLVRASFLEIYMEEIRDLLAKDQSKKLELKEKPNQGVYVKDLSSFVTKNKSEIEHIMEIGNKNRSVGTTNMNEQSSRSHAIFIITIECSEKDLTNADKYKIGKLNLVDLAGSERQTKTGAEGDRFKEATKINLSLSALGNVISALVDKKSTHVPYRDSKLTRLLQDSLGGNAKTIMVANIGPASYNMDETLTTLRYANRAKNIKNIPKINEDPKDALLRKFQDELNSLKQALQKSNKLNLPSGTNMADFEDELKNEKNEIMNNRVLIEEEKKQLLMDLNKKESLLRQEKDVQENLMNQIQKMESKLLSGGKDMLHHTNEQQQILEDQRKQIMEHAKIEDEMKNKLNTEEETTLNLAETFISSQQEAEVKTKQLKKLFQKLQFCKSEINDLIQVNSKERSDMESALNDLIKELKLKILIVNNFIPQQEKVNLLKTAKFDEEEDNWVVDKLKITNQESLSTLSNLGLSIPLAKKREENILQINLEMPTRTTKDYEGPIVAPKIQAFLDAAFAEEKDVEIAH